jgi:hypothetical protein
MRETSKELRMNSANSSVLISAIRGPILLITLGTLVALDYFAGYRFSRTWPILIIVFGVLKLLERLAAPPGRSTPGGYTSSQDNVI